MPSHGSPEELPLAVRYARLGVAALAWLFVAGVLVQVFIVGLEAFKVGVGETLHRDWAYTYGWLLPVMLVLARFGRAPVGLQVSTLLLLVLFAVQTALPVLSEQFALVGPLHAANALVLFSLGVVVAQRAGRLVRAGAGSGPAS